MARSEDTEERKLSASDAFNMFPLRNAQRDDFDSSLAYMIYLQREEEAKAEIFKPSSSAQKEQKPLTIVEETKTPTPKEGLGFIEISGRIVIVVFCSLLALSHKLEEENTVDVYIPETSKTANKDFLEHEGVLQDIARVEQKKKTVTPLILKLESEDKGLFVFLPPGNTATEFNKIVVCHQMRAEKSTGPSKSVTETFTGIMHFTPADGFTKKAIYEETSPTYAAHSYDLYKYGNIQMTACPSKLYKLAQGADDASIMVRELNAETYFGTGLRGKINHLINKF